MRRPLLLLILLASLAPFAGSSSEGVWSQRREDPPNDVTWQGIGWVTYPVPEVDLLSASLTINATNITLRWEVRDLAHRTFPHESLSFWMTAQTADGKRILLTADRAENCMKWENFCHRDDAYYLYDTRGALVTRYGTATFDEDTNTVTLTARRDPIPLEGVVILSAGGEALCPDPLDGGIETCPSPLQLADILEGSDDISVPLPLDPWLV